MTPHEIDWRGSRTGVRLQDGAIVFAIPAEEVVDDERGCKALLCAAHRSPSRDTLRHCRIAARRGKAVGIVGTDEALDVRVEKVEAAYWAKWRRPEGPSCAEDFDALSVRLFRGWRRRLAR